MELEVPSVVESDASLSRTDTASDNEEITQSGMDRISIFCSANSFILA